MIKGMHALFYTLKAEEIRAFIKDKLGLPYTDTGGGWLIFDVPEADLGVHPSDKTFHSISFYCDDIKKTVEALEKRGVDFTTGISDEGWGLLTHFSNAGGLDNRIVPGKIRETGTSKIIENKNGS